MIDLWPYQKGSMAIILFPKLHTYEDREILLILMAPHKMNAELNLTKT
jgi:hypothetical protein